MTELTVFPAFGERPQNKQRADQRERQARFLEHLSLTGNVRTACRHISIAPPTAYRWRRACPHFAHGWEAALVVARTYVEEVLADRAMNGVEEQVFYHGEVIATRRRHDTRLLLAHLARLDAKAQNRKVAEAAQDFDAVLEHFARDGSLIGQDPPERNSRWPRARMPDGAAPEHPWEDESLPIVERALMYLDAQGDDEYSLSDEFLCDELEPDPEDNSPPDGYE